MSDAMKMELIRFTRQVQDFLTRDLRALPSEQHNTSPGGCAKSALFMIAESAMVNGYAADWLARGAIDQIPSDNRKAHLKSFDTEEKVLEYLNAQTDRLIAAIENFDAVALIETRPKGFFGGPSTPHADAQFAAIHMMYHVGQLNYIQTLLGDDKIHWWE